MSTKQVDKSLPPVKRIPNGLHDIVQHLGLEPEKTYADWGAVYSPASGMQSPNPHSGVVHQGITSLVRGAAQALTLPLLPGLLEYQQDHIGVNDRIIQVPATMAPADVFVYPDHDIMQNLRQASREIGTRFNGATFLSLMTSPETQQVATELGARTLMSPQQAYYFNSKVRVANQAEEAGYAVAPHIVVNEPEQVASRFKALQQRTVEYGVDPEKACYWVKFDNLFGGNGVLRYKPAKDSFEKVEQWVETTRRTSNLNNTALLIDLDIGQLPGVKRIIDNFNVQAVVGADRVSMTGVTLQETLDGKYSGGSMPLTAEKKLYAEEARRWGYPALTSAQRQGYRGYAGIDVMLCEMQDGRMRGYVLEMNGRLNGSTSLLSLNHYVAMQSGSQDTVAHNIMVPLSRPLDDFAMCKEIFGKLLYRGSESDYTGIAPIILHQNAAGKIDRVKTIAIAPDQKSLARVNRLYTEMMNLN